MEILRNLAGSLSSGFIRLAVAVGIIAAVSIFLLKPALESADHAVDRSSEASEKIFKETNSSFNFDDVTKQVEEASRRVKAHVLRSIRQSKANGTSQKLLHCVQRAHQDVHRTERCSKRFS